MTIKLLIALTISLLALSGCIVAPYGDGGYYGGGGGGYYGGGGGVYFGGDDGGRDYGHRDWR